MDEDQENMRAMKSEEEEEDHREDVRGEMVQKEDEEQEEQRGRVTPDIGAGGTPRPCRSQKGERHWG